MSILVYPCPRSVCVLHIQPDDLEMQAMSPFQTRPRPQSVPHLQTNEV